MTNHKHVDDFTAHNEYDISLELSEWQCGPKYVITGRSNKYCPNCGESLK